MSNFLDGFIDVSPGIIRQSHDGRSNGFLARGPLQLAMVPLAQLVVEPQLRWRFEQGDGESGANDGVEIDSRPDEQASWQVEQDERGSGEAEG